MRPRAPRSLALRVTLATAASVVLAFLLAFGLTYVAALQALHRQVDAAIEAEIDTLRGEFDKFGAGGLRARVEALSLRGNPFDNAIRLDDRNGETIFAGRPFEAPEGLRGGLDVEQPADGGRMIRAIGLVLPDGAGLVVARDLRPLRAIERRLAQVLFGAGALTAALLVGAGLLMARRADRRLAAVSAAAVAVMDGDLSQRLPQAGTGDELDRLTATINDMLARIEGLLATLKQVTNDLAHDLRGPLWRLRRHLEGALADARQPMVPAAVLESALGELDEVLGTFAALLRIAQVEGGARRGAFAPLDLSALVAEVVETWQAVAEESGATLVARIAPDVAGLGDAALLKQLLVNLIENALTHGGAGVQVSVALRPGPVIEVADDGPGVPEAERGKVLGRFYRLDRSRTTAGTGLGLALVAAVARLHGSEARLDDAHPGGARPGLRVQVALPRVSASA
ncbi:MAG TPA: ATP-binding protein [Roseomonas sp.]